MMDDMERAWAAGGAAEEIMEDIEQIWAAGGDAEGELELAHLRASQAAKIDDRCKLGLTSECKPC